MEMLALDRPGGHTNRMVGESATGVVEAKRMVSEVVSGMWAASTMTQRKLLFDRWRTWCSRQGIAMTQDSAVLFVAATKTSLQAQLRYCMALSGTMRRLGLERDALLTYGAALRSVGAAIPQHQALPIPRQLLLDWAFRQERSLRLATLLAWKTASRWGDVINLSRKQVIFLSPREIILDFFTNPKGRRADPFKPSRWAVITGPLTEEIYDLIRARGEFSKLTGVTTAQLDAIWRRGELRDYSAHSIKRGAISHLFQAAAAGAPIDLVALSCLAKHTTVTSLVSSTTLRYGADGVALARVLGTGRVTTFL